jgi:glycosyltransferase involved in cell wall biosynthesis
MNEATNINSLIPSIRDILERLGVAFEIIVVDGGSGDETRAVAYQLGSKVLLQQEKGYGNALKEGFREANGKHILTLDADLSHDPNFIFRMWQERESAELIIASRYVDGGSAEMPFKRYVLSLILNHFFRFGLSLSIKDLSSGYRLYQKEALDSISIEGINFEVLQEILFKILSQGWRVKEVPFHYRPRKKGQSNAKLLKFGWAYLKTFFKFWKYRNSIAFPDYDERAFYSRIPLQRYWQRKRHR